MKEMNIKECKHEWELANISYDDCYTIHYYKCSKCGKEETMSIGI